MIPKEIGVEASQSANCQSCGKAGKVVKAKTLCSLIREDRQKDITDTHYFFCRSQDCDVVYFSENGTSKFYKADLTVRVGLKEKEAPRPVCYCFHHTVEEIFEEVQKMGKSTVIDDIKLHMKDKKCSCETNNPMGSCCLETVRSYVNDALLKYGKQEKKVCTEERNCCG